jgi:hypothetical protein
VDDRVFFPFGFPFGFAEGFEDFVHGDVAEEFHQVVDRPLDGIGHVHAGDFRKKLAQERVGLGQSESSLLAGEIRLVERVHARGEKAVAESLGEHVGELRLVKIRDEDFAEGSDPDV